jgi:dihydrofolate reductase / thymidylate synthase
MVKIILISAFSKTKNGKLGIGFEGKLPWNVPEDLKHFKELTMGKTVVMGRKTYESIGKSLPNRTNIVLTRDTKFKKNGVITCHDIYELIDIFGKQNNEVYIIGGQEIYEKFLSFCGSIIDSVILTEIKRNGNMYKNTYITCDRFFPLLDKNYILDNYTEYKVSENELYSYRFLSYSKSNKRINCNESVYINLIKNVIENGNTREDRSGVGTISNFGNLLKFDISNSVPLLTTKRVAWKTAIEEMLWMLSGSTDSKVLENKGINIWKGHTSREFLDKQGFNCYEEGSLPYGYGHQIRNAGGDTDTCPNCNEEINIDGVDQLLYIENELKTNPFSRRILWNLWTANQMNKVPLQPCHLMIQFYVTEIEGIKHLSAMVTMRSNDLGCGNPFNIFNYTALVYMMAMKCDMKPKDLVFSIGDAHIYNNHITQLQEQISRQILAAPKLHLDPSIKFTSWHKITIDQFDIVGYIHHSSVKLPMNI